MFESGVANGGPTLHQDVADFRQNVEVNLIGVFIVTQASPFSQTGLACQWKSRGSHARWGAESAQMTLCWHIPFQQVPFQKQGVLTFIPYVSFFSHHFL
jgi:hypothetical protein